MLSDYCKSLHLKFTLPKGKTALASSQSPKIHTNGSRNNQRSQKIKFKLFQVISTLDGFKDSVVRTAFSKDGSFYAACDMSGVIKAFKTATHEMVWEFETSDITVNYIRENVFPHVTNTWFSFAFHVFF